MWKVPFGRAELDVCGELRPAADLLIGYQQRYYIMLRSWSLSQVKDREAKRNRPILSSLFRQVILLNLRGEGYSR